MAVSFTLLDPQADEVDPASKPEGNVVAVADPTWMEEQVGGGRLTMAINRNGELVTLVKTGGEATDMQLMQNECLFIARSRAVAIIDAIQAAIVKARGQS